jgi:pilus assembly protein Flp/PilA
LQRYALIVFKGVALPPQHSRRIATPSLPEKLISKSDGTMRLATRAVRTFLNDEDGATLVEYGLLILIIACLAVVTVRQIGGKVSKGFESINSNLP